MRNVFDRGRLLRRVPIAVLAGLIAVGPGGTVGHTAKGPTASPRPADDVRRLGPRVEPVVCAVAMVVTRGSRGRPGRTLP